MDEAMERLRALIEAEEDVRFWGQNYKITPRLVQHVYGKGDTLIAIVPLNTRPNYYVIIADASWDDDAFFEAWDAEIHEDICTDFSTDAYDDDGNEIEEDEQEIGWPVANFDSGWVSKDYKMTREVRAALEAVAKNEQAEASHD